MKKSKWLSFALLLALPLAVGLVAAWLTPQARSFYEAEILTPPASPPGWVFAVVWPVLYLLMGAASWLVWRAEDCPTREKGLTAYATQLILNFFWPLFFFRLEAFGLSLLWLVLLLLAAVWTAWLFGRCKKAAGLMLVPYLLWLCYALYLTYGVWRLN